MIVISPETAANPATEIFTARAYRDQAGDYTLQIVNSCEGSTFFFSTQNPETFRRLCGDLFQAAQDGFELLPEVNC